MSSLEKLYDVMKELDEVVDMVDKRKKETEQELEAIVSSIKAKISDDLNKKITQLINEHKASIDARTEEEVKKFMEANSKGIEKLIGNKDKVTEKAVHEVMALLGFS